MEQILTFTLNHWALSAALVLIIILILTEEMRGKQSGAKLSPQDVIRLINTENAVVLDLREKVPYEDGHITQATHLAQSDVMDNLNKINKLKNKPLILIDTTGHQSSIIRTKLCKEGFMQVFVLSGGINAWKEAGLPLVKKGLAIAGEKRHQ